MPRISTDNYDTVASWNGSQDLFVVEQPDGTKVATPAMVKQYVLGNSIDDIYSVMGQTGAKNLIPYPYYEKTHVESGITWTDNGDGTVTADGTATATTYFILTQRTQASNMADSLIEGERYILTGCPAGGSNQKYDIFINETYNSAEVGMAFDYGSGATFTLNHKTETNYGIGLRIKSGQTVSNLTFKPMLRLAADTDNTYQPYAMTNKQLTEQVADVKDTIGDITQTGITGDSVAAQLTTAKGQIANVNTAVARLSGNYSTTLYTDFNDLPHGSIVQLMGSVPHSPGYTARYYVVFTYFIAGTTTYKLQFAIENGSGDIFTRNCTNNTWGNWNKFATI